MALGGSLSNVEWRALISYSYKGCLVSRILLYAIRFLLCEYLILKFGVSLMKNSLYYLLYI